MSEKKCYKQRQRESGIKPGDVVFVLRGVEDHEAVEQGWCDSWVPSMDKFIGKQFIAYGHSSKTDACFILYEDNDREKENWNFPYFCLRKVNSSKNCLLEQERQQCIYDLLKLRLRRKCRAIS